MRARVEEHAAAFAASAARRRADLDPLAPRFRAAVEELQPLVDGMGVVAAPGLLEDAPMWLEWWRGGGHRLAVRLEPGAPDSYPYPEAEWFRVPQGTGRAWITGPHVDPGGVNERLFTYTVPVRDAGSAFIGVAGADLAAARIEQLACRVLATVPSGAMLVNRDARVIAANRFEVRAGDLLRGPQARWVAQPSPSGPQRRGGAVLVRDADLPWAVLAEAA